MAPGLRLAGVRSGPRVAVAAGLLALTLTGVVASAASAEQASAPTSSPAGRLDAGGSHSCAVLAAGSARCWGLGSSGQLGNGATAAVGDDESPGSVGPVSVGGRTVTAIATGDSHTCAILDDGSVRCWGFGGDGRLGYANTSNISDPGAAGSVDLGGRAVSISAGSAHTCAILEDGSVRCWGYGGGDFPFDGRLGYGNTRNIGDNETPASAGAVPLGRRSAVAISAGGEHTCALLDDRTVKCWGRNDSGQLGYGNRTWLGDRPTTTPDKIAAVDIPSTAVAISAGGAHTCALLADGSVRCWGKANAGQLGYANTENIGDNETPGTVGAVDVGGAVVAISAGDAHTCAVLIGGGVRCWGSAANGRLGYPDRDSLGNQNNVGDNETPASAGPVDVGAGRTATAVSAGREHTCARLDDGTVRCWGKGAFGRLGYCSVENVGDNESPGSAGPINLQTGDGGALCPGSGSPALQDPTPSGAASTADRGPVATPAGAVSPAAPGASPSTTPRPGAALAAGSATEAKRAQGLRRCRAAAAHQSKRLRRAALLICLKRFGRTPGRVPILTARAISSTRVILTFPATGTDGSRPPAARNYLVKQSRHPIRTARDFTRAQTLCHGTCHLTATTVGAENELTVTRLHPHTTYHYAIAARDNVTGRPGPRSPSVKSRTRR